jgi:hypothetical protein
VLVDRYPLPLIKDGFFALHRLFIKKKVCIFATTNVVAMDETAIYDYSSVRICLNANIHTFFFINRRCKAKKPSLMRGRGYRSASTPPRDPPFKKLHIFSSVQ